MNYLSLFSGIEAATVAWHPLGWKPLAFAEVEAFPSAVLAHHYPQVPNLGDVQKASWDEYTGAADVVVGGSPCQSFSVAGLRGGLADPRGNLALEFFRAVDATRPRWVVWENVPGVLSSNSGRDFGAIVGALAELGYGWAYRVLDAQHFGVPQRRRRVFVVGCFGDWRGAAAVLFERHSLSGYPAPSRKSVNASTRRVETRSFNWKSGGDARGLELKEYVQPLTKQQTPALLQTSTVRRLTPRECERLQGFPDDYTDVPYRGKPATDTPRYKALGNSMAVPVMRWIGQRLQMVESSEATE